MSTAGNQHQPGSQPLGNSRQEKFCQNLATGMKQSEAYRLSGYSSNLDSSNANAARLIAIDSVRERAHLLKQVAASEAVLYNNPVQQSSTQSKYQKAP
jgi:hypothetical protein